MADDLPPGAIMKRNVVKMDEVSSDDDDDSMACGTRAIRTRSIHSVCRSTSAPHSRLSALTLCHSMLKTGKDRKEALRVREQKRNLKTQCEGSKRPLNEDDDDDDVRE
eukprot:5030764-Prymnesium_polylepis.1